MQNQKNDKKRLLPALFFTMLKIGAFTFGGGYAMIALLEEELIRKKHWIERDEFLDMVAIAESTPGPIAINSATYIGYTLCGWFGALLATIAVCLPAFTIIYVISLFFDAFLELRIVTYAFRGIQVGVVALILRAGAGMFRSMKKTALSLSLFSLTVVGMILGTLGVVKLSSVIYILIGGVVGVAVFLVTRIRARGRGGEGS